jgi:thymidylate synthase
MHTYSTFTDAYYGLLRDVYENYDYECSPRDQKIREKLAVKFVIENPRARLPFIKTRNISLSYIIAEALYYFSGNEQTDWIAYYSKFWNNISENGISNSAYGARIFKPHRAMAQELETLEPYADGTCRIVRRASDTWTQWQYIIDELAKDNDSRRAVIHIRSPYDSRYAKKDVPCTMTLQFFLRNNKLELVVSMRSSDLYLGIANDVPAFTFFQELMALELTNHLGRQIELGNYTHISNSLHIYERNFKQVEDILNNEYIDRKDCQFDQTMPKMPNLPQVVQLIESECLIRHCEDINNIEKLSSLIIDYDFNDDYWLDWVKILASNRAEKLNDKTLQKNIIKSTIWTGYHKFER